MNNRNIYEIKPDFEEAGKRWEAYWNHDMLDRPVLLATVRDDKDFAYTPREEYYDRVYGDIEKILSVNLENARHTQYLGEAVPGLWTSLGTHEIATFCGYEVEWAGYTNWCRHDERPLAEILPIRLKEDSFMYRRAMEVYEKAAEILEGRMLPYGFDFHSNLDFLLSIRGDANLCMDTIDCPDLVKKGLEDSCVIFQKIWSDFAKASKSEEYGYYFDYFSEKPTTTLACDFAALISREMFDAFAVPTLTYESEVIGERCVYHWDGPDALKHKDSLMKIKNLHTFSYVPNHYENHTQMLELYSLCQQQGKGIVFTGTAGEIKNAAKTLKPSLTIYQAQIRDEKEFSELDVWLKNHV